MYWVVCKFLEAVVIKVRLRIMVFFVWLGFEIMIILLWRCLGIFFLRMVDNCLWLLGFNFFEVCMMIVLWFRVCVICCVISCVIFVGIINKIVFIFFSVFDKLV